MHKKPLLYSHFSERTTTDIYIAKILVLISIWLKYPMKIVVFSLASWVIDGDHQIWQLPEGEKAALPVLLHYCHLYIMETLGNSLGWQGWMGVESIDGEYLLAKCSHAGTAKTVNCTVDIRPGINELCMFHWLQCSATTCRYNREQNLWFQCTLFGGWFCSPSHLPHWQVSQTWECQDTPARLCPTEKFPIFSAVPLV